MEGMAATTESTPAAPTSSDLASILAAQPEAVIARYPSRNPQQTLEFFGIQPGMTVVEALPGGGWYSSYSFRIWAKRASLLAPTTRPACISCSVTTKSA